MILFDLQCTKGHIFEGWFQSNAAYEKQASMHMVACPFCADSHIVKAPMAPKLLKSSGEGGKEVEVSKVSGAGAKKSEMAEVMALLKTLKQEIIRNAKDVGNGFAEEARKMHYGEKEKENIVGTSTLEEAKELREEGIECLYLPSFPKLDS